MKSNFKVILILAGMLSLASPDLFSQPATVTASAVPASTKFDIKSLEEGNVSKDAAINALKTTLEKVADPSFEFFGKGSNSLPAILSVYGVAKDTLDKTNSQVDENKKILEIFKNFAGVETDLKPSAKSMTVDEADDALMNFMVSKLLQPKQSKTISNEMFKTRFNTEKISK